jgi:hypothetical protein
MKGGAGGGVGRGGAGERPRFLWCCGGTRGLAVAPGSGSVEMRGDREVVLAGGGGGVWQIF